MPKQPSNCLLFMLISFVVFCTCFALAYPSIATPVKINAMAFENCDLNSICPTGYTCCYAKGDYPKTTCRQTNATLPNLGCAVQEYNKDTTCKTGIYQYDSSRVQKGNWVLGSGFSSQIDPSSIDFIVMAGDLQSNDQHGLDLKLTFNGPNTPALATVVTNTRHMLYGKVTAFIDPIVVPGAVSAFITMSEINDEIDFEFAGNPIQVQSNVFYHVYGKSPDQLERGQHYKIHSQPKHGIAKYTIEWQPDFIQWLVDDVPLRTLFKNQSFSALNSTQAWFPDTPSLVQLGVWDGQGSPWAGGPINWPSNTVVGQSFLSTSIYNLTIECY